MDFDKIIICVKSQRKYNIQNFWDLRRHSITKIYYFERQEQNFSHICETKTIFLSDLRKMTYKHYLNQPKSMIEWKLNEKLSGNPELIKSPGNISHPLIKKYKYSFPPEENQNLL